MAAMWEGYANGVMNSNWIARLSAVWRLQSPSHSMLVEVRS